MNFYEEIAQELKAAGLTGSKIFRIPDEMSPTLDDYAELERNITIRTRKNEEMLTLSIMYAKESILC